jgi:hypothetical protein
VPKGIPTDKLTTVISVELKERLKNYAESKHWSMSQATAILLQEALNRAETEAQEKKTE